MEQKVDRTFLSGESRLEIYKQVLKELRVAYKYNESVKYNTYQMLLMKKVIHILVGGKIYTILILMLYILIWKIGLHSWNI